MSKRKPPVRTSSIEVHPLKGKREGALIQEQIWFDGDRIVAYSLAYINLRICRVDHGRVLGFDNSHDFHHRHFMGRVEPVEYTSYDATSPASSAKCMNSGDLKMKTKITIRTGTTDEFFDRLRDRARKLDKGEMPRPGITITFEDPLEMLRVLSSERVRLLRMVKEGPQQVSALATSLNRNVRAVSRDVSLLEKAGLLHTRYESNPGHGRLKLVEPIARQYKLVASL